jgi:hypothetical protein
MSGTLPTTSFGRRRPSLTQLAPETRTTLEAGRASEPSKNGGTIERSLKRNQAAAAEIRADAARLRILREKITLLRRDCAGAIATRGEAAAGQVEEFAAAAATFNANSAGAKAGASEASAPAICLSYGVAGHSTASTPSGCRGLPHRSRRLRQAGRTAAKKSFRDPVLVRAVRRLQSRLP